MIKTIIVEDDPMVAEINRRFLEKIPGFQLVKIAPTVNEALVTLENHDIDLILLDIYMPGEDGWSLLSQIRGVDKGIDIIIISAACDKQSIQKGLRFGVVDYLIKPFEFDRFQSALTKYKEEASFINDQEKMKQCDLDQFFFGRNQQNTVELELPKGLTKNTLKNTWEKIIVKRGEIFSTEEIAHEVGISRVSMRKYLFFLAEINMISTELVYGAVGRPIYMHRLNELNEDLINQYVH